MSPELKRTALYDLHIELGGKMVPFAGYEMPVQYPMGVMQEHLHTRAKAGLFDVSHMGQILITPRSGRIEDAARALERLVPVDILGLKEGRQRYALFTDPQGGILDDLMVAQRGDHLFLVVNAACKAQDLRHLKDHLSDSCDITAVEDRALLALQGPLAEAALARLLPDAAGLRFMDVAILPGAGGEVWVSRSGYTGEDGYEISVAARAAERVARDLLEMEEVAPIGLGARDSLRLEAGLCLYGTDIDRATTPSQAALNWAVQNVRRTGGARAGGFPGADVVLSEIDGAPARLRVGLRPEGRAPMRAGTLLYAREDADRPIGAVTSGAYGPSLGAPMSMGYVARDHAAAGNRLWAELRGKRLPATVSRLPFLPANYKR
ncbi:glycine cleavage system aminomethyltransferase GcvT [Brevirhabdus sp.]|uniref:glycine cleavage system aminomethyltransferase GcvT n=1 Tax=Brevirhabdus sp. TaxID=2004514 RepID=UPI004058EF6C